MAWVILGTLVLEIAPTHAAASLQPRVGRNVPVTPQDLVQRTVNNSPQLLADPKEPRFVVLASRLDGPDFSCALQVSGDGGRSWISADPVPRLPKGAEKCYAPEVAFDGDGRLYYLFLGLSGLGNSPMGVFLTTSDDRGQSFSKPRKILGKQRYAVRMAIDPDTGARGRIHLVWIQTGTDPPLGGFPATPNPIMAAHSDDGGETFSKPLRVSDPSRPRAVAPALSLGPSGAVHVIYYDLRDDIRDYQGLEGPPWEGTWSLISTTSTDEGRSFRRGVVIDDALVPPERVMLIFTMPPASASAGDRGRLYVAWHDARNGDWDVFVSRSSDRGRSWRDPVRVNDDPLRNGSHQYMPRLSVAPEGRVDVIFYDRRGNVENRGNDVFYSFSPDGARTFSRNTKLTGLDSDSKIGPRYDVPSAQGLNEFGSRIALVSRPSSVLAAWTDTRNTGRAFPAQDIFSATVRLRSGRK